MASAPPCWRLGRFEHIMLSALLIAVPMALAGRMLARRGIETRGNGLEAIQRALGNSTNNKAAITAASVRVGA